MPIMNFEFELWKIKTMRGVFTLILECNRERTMENTYKLLPNCCITWSPNCENWWNHSHKYKESVFWHPTSRLRADQSVFFSFFLFSQYTHRSFAEKTGHSPFLWPFEHNGRQSQWSSYSSWTNQSFSRHSVLWRGHAHWKCSMARRGCLSGDKNSYCINSVWFEWCISVPTKVRTL